MIGDPSEVQKIHVLNPLCWDAITKYAKNVLDCYCRPLFCPLEWFAQKTKSDSFVKKITFCFLTKSEKCDWVILPKIGQKLIIT